MKKTVGRARCYQKKMDKKQETYEQRRKSKNSVVHGGYASLDSVHRASRV